MISSHVKCALKSSLIDSNDLLALLQETFGEQNLTKNKFTITETVLIQSARKNITKLFQNKVT